ncbi:MAG TPA: ATP-binding protein, partial [Novosphingobium sp.]|nr:ATP-binding protein [Novosphingobium sp.]
MTAIHILVVAVMFYLALLAFVGWRAGRAASPRHRAMRYGLSLATICTAWTYFAGVGGAGEGSWLFLANALGSVMAITLLRPIWRRIAVLAKQENVGSLADFLAARFGKSRTLGVVVAAVAMLGTLPYFALQFEVLVDAAVLATGSHTPSQGAHAGAAAALVAALAAMAIGFGTQRPSLTQNNRGLVSIISLESVVKISGLLAVAGLCLVLLMAAPVGPSASLPARLWAALPSPGATPLASFLMLTFLCTVTAFTVPRQFHLGFVAIEAVEDITPASAILPFYFGLWVTATLIIGTAMRAGLAVPGVDPVMQVLAIPLAHGAGAVALLAWLGGLSAGAAMVIVELTAISGMVSNEIVLPLLRPLTHGGHSNVAERIVRVRRATVIAIAALAWLYDAGMRGQHAPVQLGMTALAAFAQFAPPLFGGLWWRGGHARGAIAGIAVGFAVWAVAVAAPAFVSGQGSAGGWSGALPDTSWKELAIAASLVANTLAFVGVSWRTAPRLIDTIQAEAFVVSADAPARLLPDLDTTVADLRRLLATFLGAAEADRALAEMRAAAGQGDDSEAARVSPHLVRRAERLLAGVIGASSARNVIALTLAAGRYAPAEITHLLDEAGHAVHFSRELLQTTLESLPQGVCVLGRQGEMIAWNGPWLGFLGLGPDAVYVGKGFADTLALPPAWPDGWRHGLAFDAELNWAAEQVLLLRGRPLVSGDFLMTMADITEIKHAQQVLAQNQEVLEARVAQRTAELTRANVELDAARHLAELATNAQQRFVAAASHDLVQPLHAARLFIGNARLTPADAMQAELLRKADEAVEGANRLLGALLKLSQIEVGALTPHPGPVDARALFASLAGEFEPMARGRGLSLVVMPTRFWLHSDRDLLRSLLQNLIVNALRYTPRGRVVLCARHEGPAIRIEVRDSGVGIDAARLPQAFGAFTRLAGAEALSEGAGLGLAIVARIAEALGHRLSVRSREGAGSTFAVTVPVAAAVAARPVPFFAPVDLAGLRVLCVEDDEDVRIATSALIGRWGGVVTACEGVRSVPAGGAWDVVIADYCLGDGDGLSLLRGLA